MKMFVTLLLAFCCLQPILAQNSFQILYGDTQGYFSAGASEAVQDADGSYVIAGFTENYAANTGNLSLLKTDSAGSVKWFKTYAVAVGQDSKTTTIGSLQKTFDGGYIIAGSAYGIQSNADVFVMKTDNSGNVLWHKIFNGFGKSEARAIKETSSGEFIIVGATDDLGPVSQYSTSLYALKLTATGDTIWTKTYNYDDDSKVVPGRVQVLSDGNYLIGATGYPANPWPGDGLPVLMKVNAANGNIIWSKGFGTPTGYPLSESLADVELSPDGNYIIAGTTSNYTKLDGLLMKIDASGNNILWAKVYATADSTNGDHIYSLAVNTSGSYSVYGNVFLGASSKLYNLFMKTDASGNIAFSKLVGNGLNNYGASILLTNDNGFLLSGFEIADFDFDAATAYVIKADANGSSGCYETPVDFNVSNLNLQVVAGPVMFKGGGVLLNETVIAFDQFLPVTVLCQNPPPELVFTLFTGKNTSGKNVLNWKTKSEVKSDRYYIQKSTDKTDIATIGKVDATFKTLNDVPYKFTDNKQVAGTHYYRIKAVHKNGKISYSKIISITGISNIIVSNTTIPATVLFRSEEVYDAAAVSFSIFSAVGNKVYDGKINNSYGKIHSAINLSFLQNGIYYVSFNTSDNTERHQIVITH